MLDVHRDGRLLRLRLNRPEKRNALNLALCLQLTAAIESRVTTTREWARFCLPAPGARFAQGWT